MTLPAIPDGFGRTMSKHGMVTSQAESFGPHGFRVIVTDAVTGMSGSIIVTQSDQDDVEWLHASLAWEEQDPSYAEMHALHLAVFGRRRWSYALNAPESEHVNIHSHALHLFGRVDGKPVLPDFTRGSGSI